MSGFICDVCFTLNGERVKLTNISPHLTLLEWLRAQPGLTGTKKMCGEGGCGCCVVSVTRKDPATEKDHTIAINSCLCPLYSVHDWTIETVEGIGSSHNGFHPIQKTVAQYNGSQCGYCTPGFVMSMYSLLKEKNERTEKEIEDCFDGNICRCTGYRPILDGMKSFAIDSKQSQLKDIEDISPEKCFSCPLKWVTPSPHLNGDPVWYRPTQLSEVFEIFRASKNSRVKLICGSTGKGIFKNEGKKDVIVDLKNIPELSKIELKDSSLVIGAAVSINRLRQVLLESRIKSTAFPHLANHLKKIANVAIRNIGSWAGNLMLTHDHENFPSDFFTIMEAVGATITIVNFDGSKTYSLNDFLGINMANSVIVSMCIPFCNEQTWFRSFKISPRAENTYAYVVAAFQMEVDPSTNRVKNSPSFVFGGIEKCSFSAKSTQAFMKDKDITLEDTLREALQVLTDELHPNSPTLAASTQYRKSLAVNLFYKFYLTLLGERVDGRFRSAATPFLRPISKGSQSYGSDPSKYPLTKAMPKLTSTLQASGEAQYTTDVPTQNGELAAAFVLTSLANANILEIDTSNAMSMPGAIRIITAKDIPRTGRNDFKCSISDPEPVIIDKYSEYAGQPVAIVIADTQTYAEQIAQAVNIRYEKLGKPILTLEEAIEAGSFHDEIGVEAIKVGNTEDVISKSDHIITGKVKCGTQYHFHMETQTALVVPEDDGYTVHSSTQWVHDVQNSVSSVLGIDCNRVNVVAKRVGGGYGAKISLSSHTAAACALGAYLTGRPVRMHMDLETNMKSMGKRFPYLAEYTVGATQEGLLNAVKIDVYSDAGCYKGDNEISVTLSSIDSAYKCPNWLLTPYSCKTNTASNTYCRTPAHVPAVFIIESIMDHLAKSLKLDPEQVRETNLYRQGDVSFVSDQKGMPLTYCNIRDLWTSVYQSADVENRKQKASSFNNENRWRKRGLSLVPMKYGIIWKGHTTTVLVSIYATDGTVSIAHGGVEIGQGINTKVAQVAAKTLGIDISLVVIKPTNTLTNPNGSPTGGSINSELNCKAVLDACLSLKDRLDKVKETMKKEGKSDPTWFEQVAQANNSGVDLSSKGYVHGESNYFFNYNTYGVTCAEVEIDVLTGETEVLRVDILYDCGESMNPDVDIGQVEGAFVMGLGYWLTEKTVYDPDSGQLLTHNTWEYNPPSSKDIPQDLRVSLLRNAPNPLGILRSKAVGEPPMVMSNAVLFAVKRAIESARHDAGSDDLVFLYPPATPEDIHLMCLSSDLKRLVFN